MKKITNKQIFTGVLVVALALCLLVYLMVYNKYTQMTETLKTSNNALQTQVDELKVYYDNMQTYRTDTANMIKGIDELTADYTSQANEEDFIMTAVDMQKESIINFETVNIDEEDVIHTIPAETVTGSGIEGLEQQIDFVARKASYESQTDYANLKYALQVIFDKENRVGIDTVSFTRESEDNNFITGAIDISYYTIMGMNKDYEYPKMDGYLSGVSDLFGKIVLDEGEEAGSDDTEE